MGKLFPGLWQRPATQSGGNPSFVILRYLGSIALALMACLAFSHSVLARQVDINTSSSTHLESVAGIGPGKAKAIMEYRAKHGPFKNVDELDNVPGFGKKTIEKIRSQLTVSVPKKKTSGNVNTVDSAGNWKGTIR